MTEFTEYSYGDYLSSKRMIDDKSMNRFVWDAMVKSLFNGLNRENINIIEIGAGIGTMIERIIDSEIEIQGNYLALDISKENIERAASRLSTVADKIKAVDDGYDVRFVNNYLDLNIQLRAIDALNVIEEMRGSSTIDLIISQAFFDLVDLENIMPTLMSLLKTDGMLYTTINFDGVTYLGPVINETLDTLIEDAYHSTMGNGFRGDLTGRRLLSYFISNGYSIHAAGSADWVVYPVETGYSKDTTYFLHYIINTIWESLAESGIVDRSELSSWIQKRHSQVENGTLTYIAHQMDFLVSN